MQFRHLEYIMEIARFENLTKAAAELNVSQSTLSTYLSSLEKELGIHLFQREKNRLKITSAGALYAKAASQMLQIRSELYARLAEMKDLRDIKIGLASEYAVRIFADIISNHSSEMEGLRIDITEGRAAPMLKQLEQGKLDLAIMARTNFPHGKVVASRLIRKESFVCCISDKSPYADIAVPISQTPPIADIRVLKKQPFILPPRDVCDGNIAAQILYEYCPDARVMCYIKGVSSILDMVRNCAGVTLLPCVIRYSIPDLNNLLWCRTEKVFCRNLLIVYRKSKEWILNDLPLFKYVQEFYDSQDIEHLVGL